MDIPDEVYDPGKFSGRRDTQPDVEETRCGTIAYTKFNAGLIVHLKGAK